MSGFSAQHDFISCMYCRGPACGDTEGRNNGGGFFNFFKISTKKNN